MASTIQRARTRPSLEGFVATARTFALLSAPTRLELLRLLAGGERAVGSLAAELDQPVPVVSYHLALLRRAGIVGVRRRGQRHVYACADHDVIGLVAAALAARQRRRPAITRPQHA